MLSDDRDAATCKLAPKALSDLGCLHVEFYRAERIHYDKPVMVNRAAPKPLDELPEAVMKGLAIKNNTK